MMHQLLDILRHLPDYLHSWADLYGAGVYLILGLIIFAETGLVVTPFLPGDSLLFATGALLSLNLPHLDLVPMIFTLITAAVVGDTLNFHVGQFTAKHFFKEGTSRWLNPKHLARTQAFYARHGGRTVVLARFLPILRTYAPFVAGLGGMRFARFFMFSLGGGTLWIGMFVSLGYYFGNLPSVKDNFHYAIFAIIGLSLLPIAFEFLRKPPRATQA